MDTEYESASRGTGKGVAKGRSERIVGRRRRRRRKAQEWGDDNDEEIAIAREIDDDDDDDEDEDDYDDDDDDYDGDDDMEAEKKKKHNQKDEEKASAADIASRLRPFIDEGPVGAESDDDDDNDNDNDDDEYGEDADGAYNGRLVIGMDEDYDEEADGEEYCGETYGGDQRWDVRGEAGEGVNDESAERNRYDDNGGHRHGNGDNEGNGDRPGRIQDRVLAKRIQGRGFGGGNYNYDDGSGGHGDDDQAVSERRLYDDVGHDDGWSDQGDRRHGHGYQLDSARTDQRHGHFGNGGGGNGDGGGGGDDAYRDDADGDRDQDGDYENDGDNVKYDEKYYYQDDDDDDDEDELSRIEEEIGLAEATLASLNSKLASIEKHIASRRLEVSVRRGRIDSLKERATHLRKARDTNAALVRTVEGTLRKCVDRLKKALQKSRDKEEETGMEAEGEAEMEKEAEEEGEGKTGEREVEESATIDGVGGVEDDAEGGGGEAAALTVMMNDVVGQRGLEVPLPKTNDGPEDDNDEDDADADGSGTEVFENAAAEDKSVRVGDSGGNSGGGGGRNGDIDGFVADLDIGTMDPYLPPSSDPRNGKDERTERGAGGTGTVNDGGGSRVVDVVASSVETVKTIGRFAPQPVAPLHEDLEKLARRLWSRGSGGRRERKRKRRRRHRKGGDGGVVIDDDDDDDDEDANHSREGHDLVRKDDSDENDGEKDEDNQARMIGSADVPFLFPPLSSTEAIRRFLDFGAAEIEEERRRLSVGPRGSSGNRKRKRRRRRGGGDGDGGSDNDGDDYNGDGVDESNGETYPPIPETLAFESLLRGSCLDAFAHVRWYDPRPPSVSHSDADVTDAIGGGDDDDAASATPCSSAPAMTLASMSTTTTTTTTTTTVDPTIPICPYELAGECADPTCRYQHLGPRDGRDEGGATAGGTRKQAGAASGVRAAGRTVRPVGAAAASYATMQASSSAQRATTRAVELMMAMTLPEPRLPPPPITKRGTAASGVFGINLVGRRNEEREKENDGKRGRGAIGNGTIDATVASAEVVGSIRKRKRDGLAQGHVNEDDDDDNVGAVLGSEKVGAYAKADRTSVKPAEVEENIMKRAVSSAAAGAAKTARKTTDGDGGIVSDGDDVPFTEEGNSHAEDGARRLLARSFEDQDDFIGLPNLSDGNDGNYGASYEGGSGGGGGGGGVFITDIRAGDGDESEDGSASSESDDGGEDRDRSTGENGAVSLPTFLDAISAIGFEAVTIEATSGVKKCGGDDPDGGDAATASCIRGSSATILRCVDRAVEPSASASVREGAICRARLVERALHLVRASVHAGRYDIADAAVSMARGMRSGGGGACRDGFGEAGVFDADGGVLGTILEWTERAIDAALACPSGAFADNIFDAQLALAVLAQFAGAYRKELEVEGALEGGVEEIVVANESRWKRLFFMLRLATGSIFSQHFALDIVEVETEKKHLEDIGTLLAGSTASSERKMYSENESMFSNEAKFDQRLRRCLRAALAYSPAVDDVELLAATGISQPCGSKVRPVSHSSLRLLLWRARLGRTLGNALRSRKSLEEPPFITPSLIPHRVLEPLLQEVRRHTAFMRDFERDDSCLCFSCEAGLTSIAIIGPVLLATVATSLSELSVTNNCTSNGRSNRSLLKRPIQRTSLCTDARADGILTGLYRSVLRMVRQLQGIAKRCGKNGRGCHNCRGELVELTSSLLLAPLLAVCAALCVSIASYEVAHHFIESSLFIDYAAGGSVRHRYGWCDAWQIHSELLWSQLLRLHMMLPQKGSSAVGPKPKSQSEHSGDRCALIAGRAIEYGVFPFHVTASFGGDSLLALHAAEDHVPTLDGTTRSEQQCKETCSNAFRACGQMISALFKVNQSSDPQDLNYGRGVSRDNVAGEVASGNFFDVNKCSSHGFALTAGKPISTVVLNGIFLHREGLGTDGGLVSFPLSFHSLGGSLSRLSMRQWNLRSLPESLGRFLFGLKILDISCNSLSYLPSSLCRMKLLCELNVSTNQLSLLPHDIGSLSELRVLIASKNKIGMLPKSIVNCTQLEILDLRQNPIQKIPGDLPLRLSRLHSFHM